MRDHKIDYIKCLCAVFVIMHHSIYYITNEYGCAFPAWFDFVTSPIYAHVSLFIIVAGYLCHEQPLKPYYTKKFKRIIVPFLVFSLLKILYGALISRGYAHGDSLPGQFFDAFVMGRLYWFSYCMFILYCTAPLLWAGARRSDVFPFAALLVFLCICAADEHTGCLSAVEAFQLNNVVRYMPFFLAGYILQLHQREILPRLEKTGTLPLIAVFTAVYLANHALYQYTEIGLKTLFVFIKRLSVLAVLYAAVRRCRPNPVVGKIAAYSYQLMLIDSFTRVVILRVIDRFFTVSPYWMLPQTVLSVAACVLICEILSGWRTTRFLLGL